MPEGFPDIIITVEIDGQTHKRNLSRDLHVDEDNINEYLIEAPAKVAYWNSLYRRQKTITQRLKMALDVIRAELAKNYRQAAAAAGKKVTNAEVEEAVILDPRYQEAANKLLEAQETEGLLKSAVDALHELRSTLISLAANLRAAGDITLKARANDFEERIREQLAAQGRRR